MGAEQEISAQQLQLRLLEQQNNLVRHLERMCNTYSASQGYNRAADHPAFRDSRALLASIKSQPAVPAQEPEGTPAADELNDEQVLDILEHLILVAQRHGEDSDPGHEVGDLQAFIRSMWWETLTPAQRRSYLSLPEVLETVSAATAEEVSDVSLLDRDGFSMLQEYLASPGEDEDDDGDNDDDGETPRA